MNSKPEKIQMFAMIPCWVWIFILVPMFMPFLGLGLWEQWEVSVWLEIGYHVVNGIALFLIMFSYLKEEWFMVTTNVLYHLKHVALTVGLILVAEFALLCTLFNCGVDITNMFENLPIAEMSVSHTPLFLIDLQPIFGSIVLSVFAPVSICALFYFCVFAPICYKKPVLAYIGVAVATLIPPVIDIIWRGNAPLVMSGYLVQLPIHLLACWSYQKTDNAWTPIISLAAVNLVMSIVLPLVLFR